MSLSSVINKRLPDQRSRFRILVGIDNGVTLYAFGIVGDFCCGPGDSSINACVNGTEGSTDPFPVQAGRVIFNRTSGSIYPNSTNITTVTLLSTAAPSTTATPITGSTICHNSTSSSNSLAAVGSGVGVPLGLALFGVLGLLWRQRREARVWKVKYDELRREKRGDSINIEERNVQELPHECWRPDEIDGRLVYEVAGRMG